tara:strand:+ start:758 stop:928 length:171 start_codon:yes stop_codon:yes gene_type:complete
MLRRYLEQRHTDLDSGCGRLALERDRWQVLEVQAYEDGWEITGVISSTCGYYRTSP